MKNKIFALLLLSALVIPSFVLVQGFTASAPQPNKPANNSLPSQTLSSQQGKLTTPSPVAVSAVNLRPEPKFLSPQPGRKLNGSVKVEFQLINAKSVELYLRKTGSLVSIYLGDGLMAENNQWSFQWDTSLTPNGHYGLFLKVQNQYGSYQTKEVPIEVANTIAPQEEKNQAVVESVQKIQEEAKTYQNQIEDQNKKTKDSVVKEAKDLVSNVMKQIPQDQRTKVQPIIDQNLEKSIPQIASGLQLAQEKIKTEVSLQDSLRQKEKERGVHAQKIAQEKKALAALNKNTSLGTQQIAKDVAVQDHLAKINKREETQKEVAQSILSLQKQLTRVQQEKQAVIKNIQNNVVKTVQPAVSIVQKNTHQQAALQKNITETQKTVAKQVEDFTHTAKTKETSALQVLAKLKKDSDGDGIPDVEELKIGTDPLNPDTDGDGYLDGVEVKLGYDPLKASSADKVVYEQPTKSKAPITETYQVTKVSLVTTPATSTSPNKPKYLKIEGKGLPLSFVTIYLYSSPLVLVTKTDAEGNFNYVIERPLAEGYHRVYVAVTDNKGEIVERSSAFQFLKTPTAIAAVMPPVPGLASATASPAKTLGKTYTILILSIIVLALAVALSMIGFLATRKKQNLS